jgi:hypothetical protein
MHNFEDSSSSYGLKMKIILMAHSYIIFILDFKAL